MPTVQSRDAHEIFYRSDCIAPPWVDPPQTVLMHHGVALNGDAWAGWLPRLLAAGFRVVRIDMRGFGRSGRVNAEHRWSIDQFFADVDAVLAELQVDSFHFVGESLGGLIGLALAARRPASVRSLCLLSTPFDGSRIGPALDTWRDIIDRDGMPGWAAALMPMRFAPEYADTRVRRWVEELQASCDPHAVWGQAQFIRTQNLTSELPAIKAPTLILAPDGSPFVGTSLARDLHQLLPGSEIRWYPGERHSLLLSRGDDCAAAFVEFMARRARIAA